MHAVDSVNTIDEEDKDEDKRNLVRHHVCQFLMFSLGKGLGVEIKYKKGRTFMPY